MAVIILGAGVVGLTLANLLVKIDKTPITVIDIKPPVFNWDSTQYDLRCSAINLASEQILRTLNVWDNITAQRTGYYDQMLVWDDLEHNAIQFTATDIGVRNLGHIIENRILHRTLFENLQNSQQVQFLYGKAEQLEITDESASLKIGDQQLIAQLIVGADGANSWLRSAATIAHSEQRYNQHALVATIQTQHAHNNIAMQRYNSTGNIAFLPLDDAHKCSIVWVSTADHIQRLLTNETIDFCTELAIEFNFKLGALQLTGARAGFELRRLNADRYIAQRIALIGDAAHVIHPMAGLGLNLGLQDAATLAEVLQLSKDDFGDYANLRKYERQSRSHNTVIETMVDQLQKLFASTHPMVKLMRHSGLRCVNNFSLVKRSMADLAIGGVKQRSYA